MRAETGPMRFGDDWCGVFVRGDDCAGCLMYLENLRLSANLSTMEQIYLGTVISVLSGSREPVQDVQQMRPIEECLEEK